MRASSPLGSRLNPGIELSCGGGSSQGWPQAAGVGGSRHRAGEGGDCTLLQLNKTRCSLPDFILVRTSHPRGIRRGEAEGNQGVKNKSYAFVSFARSPKTRCSLPDFIPVRTSHPRGIRRGEAEANQGVKNRSYAGCRADAEAMAVLAANRRTRFLFLATLLLDATALSQNLSQNGLSQNGYGYKYAYKYGYKYGYRYANRYK